MRKLLVKYSAYTDKEIAMVDLLSFGVSKIATINKVTTNWGCKATIVGKYSNIINKWATRASVIKIITEGYNLNFW